MKHSKHTKHFASRWGFILARRSAPPSAWPTSGASQQAGQQRRRGVPDRLSAVRGHLQPGRPAGGVCDGTAAGTGTLGAYENAWATRGKGMGKAGGGSAGCRWRVRSALPSATPSSSSYILKALVDSVRGTLLHADTASWFGRSLRDAFFRHPVSCDRRGRHAADAIPRRAQHRKRPIRS